MCERFDEEVARRRRRKRVESRTDVLRLWDCLRTRAATADCATTSASRATWKTADLSTGRLAPCEEHHVREAFAPGQNVSLFQNVTVLRITSNFCACRADFAFSNSRLAEDCSSGHANPGCNLDFSDLPTRGSQEQAGTYESWCAKSLASASRRSQIAFLCSRAPLLRVLSEAAKNTCQRIHVTRSWSERLVRGVCLPQFGRPRVPRLARKNPGDSRGAGRRQGPLDGISVATVGEIKAACCLIQFLAQRRYFSEEEMLHPLALQPAESRQRNGFGWYTRADPFRGIPTRWRARNGCTTSAETRSS